MYHKPSRFSLALILGTLVLAMTLPGGCVTNTLEPTRVPTSASTPVALTPSQEHCGNPPPPLFPDLSVQAAIDYIRLHYPEQNMPSDYRETKSSMHWRTDPAIYTTGDWTLNMLCLLSPCHVVVSNEPAGFRWEGDIHWSGGSNYPACGYTPEKVESVSETSVTVLPPNAPTRTRVPTPTTPPAERSKILLDDNVVSVAFSPDGKMLGVGIRGIVGTLVLWDVNMRQPIGPPLKGHTNSLEAIAFSPDGKTLASGGGDYTIILWDVATRRSIGQPLKRHEHPIRSLAFSPDGTLLASGSEDETIILWNVSDVTRSQIIGQPLRGHTSLVTTVAFSPDGKTLASGDWRGSIILWNVSNPMLPVQLGVPLVGPGSIGSVAFSPDGKTLAATRGGNVVLWNVSDVTMPQAIGQPLEGHTGFVYTIAFGPDGQTLASGSADKTIILWNVAARQPFGPPLTGHTLAVASVALSPDGKTLASGSWDKTVILWDVSNPRSPAQILWDVVTPTAPSPTPTRSP